MSTGSAEIKPASSLPASREPAQDDPPSTGKWWVLIAIGIGTFMSALDGSVVNVTLPLINRAFNSQVAAVEWVVTIYLLVLSGLLLSFGRLGDLRGHKKIYLAGFGIFILSSALCGLAPSVPALVIFRGIQALGAAMLSANSPAILTKSFPAGQRGQALGLQATMTYLGLTVGPSLGGWLADAFSWRAVFYINLPVGLLAFLLSVRFIRSDQPEHISEKFDFAGAGLFIAGLCALLLGLNQGFELGWNSAPILGLLAAALLLLALFVIIEQRSASPMLDLSLFRNWQFSTAVASAIFNYICVYSLIFLMPFYLINGRQFTTAHAGLILTAQPIVMAIIAPISGTLSDRLGTRWPSIAGMAVMALGLFLLAQLGTSSSTLQIVFGLGVAGLGTGTFISPNNSALMGAAPHHRQGIAAGTLATARNLGMVLGVGFSGAIFTTLLHGQDAATLYLQPTPALFRAIQVSFLAAGLIALLGMLTSFLRAASPPTP